MHAIFHSVFARAAFWNTLGFLGFRGFAILSLVVAARVLDPEEFGRLSIIYLTATVFQTLSEGGLSVVVTSSVAAASAYSKKEVAAIVGSSRLSNLALALAISLTILGLNSSMAEVLFAGHESIYARLILLVLIVSSSTANISAAALNGLRDFRLVAISNIAGGAVGLFCLYYCVHVYGVLGALLGLSAGSLVRSAMCSLFLMRETRKIGAVGLRFGKWPTTKRLFAQGFPAVVTAFIWLPVQVIALHIMTATTGAFNQAGLFSVASQIFSALLVISSIAAQVSLPFMSRSIISADPESKYGRPWQLGAAVTTVTLLASIAVWLSLEPVIDIFGAAYGAARSAITTMMLCAVIASPQGVLTNFLVANGKLWPRLWINAAAGATLLIAASIFGGDGAFGLAVAHLASWIVRTVGVCVQAVWLVRSVPARAVITARNDDL